MHLQEIERMRLRESTLEETMRLREVAHMDTITSIAASDAAHLQVRPDSCCPISC